MTNQRFTPRPGRSHRQKWRRWLDALPLGDGELSEESTEVTIPEVSQTVNERFIFSKRQKAMPISSTTQFVPYPHRVDLQPIPIRCAYLTSYNFLAWCLKNETWALSLIITCLLFVVVTNALSDYLPFRLINETDAIFFIHDPIQFLSHESRLVTSC